jgi:hypothetical protein
VINAGECLSPRKSLDRLQFQHTLLDGQKLSAQSCGATGQINFEEWLKTKLKEQGHRARIGTQG